MFQETKFLDGIVSKRRRASAILPFFAKAEIMELYVTVLRLVIELKTMTASSILPDFASWVRVRF